MMNTPDIFPIFYLPPINYLGSLLTSGRYMLFEKFEHFPKQTFRNRATILSPNGPLDLIVPVKKGSRLTGGEPGQHTDMKDVKICYDSAWQRLHWRSLESCYRSSAYFEFYEDELAALYRKKHTFLVDLNIEMLSWILQKMKRPVDIQLTASYQAGDEIGEDLRNAFHKNQTGTAKPYFQVFGDRTGFVPNLSSVDLLFNQGPQSVNYL